MRLGCRDCSTADWKKQNQQGIFRTMLTGCPKCSTMVKSTGPEWKIINTSCSELVGTQWNGKPEYCPILSVVAEPDVVLPGVATCATVQAEIDRVRIVKARP